MKVMMLAIAFLSISPAHAARDLTFTLNCAWSGSSATPVGSPRFQVVKTAFRGRGGKWETKYSLVVRPMNPNAEPTSFDFEPAGNGDEDYSDYNIVAGRRGSFGIGGASIQNQFKWANLTSTSGNHTFDCR